MSVWMHKGGDIIVRGQFYSRWDAFTSETYYGYTVYKTEFFKKECVYIGKL